jgi:hypothetical protein
MHYFFLQSDEVPGQQEVEHLSTPVTQCLEPVCPTRKQGEQRRIILSFGYQRRTGRLALLRQAQFLDDQAVFIGDRLEQAHFPQRALGAANGYRHDVSCSNLAQHGVAPYIK